MTMIEALEHRRLFSTVVPLGGAATDVVPPTLQSVRLLGHWKAATGLALTFSEPLNPATASEVSSYRVWGNVRIKSFDTDQRKLDLRSAAYDDATRTVTLTPDRPTFTAQRYLRIVFVHWTVTDVAGNRLDGDGDGRGGDDAAYFFRPPQRGHGGRSITYFDDNRSRVRLRLSGPGRLALLTRLQGERLEAFSFGWYPVHRWGEGLQLFIDGATPETVLTGSVTLGARSRDATTTLLEIINPGGAELPFLSDPAFSVGSVRTA